MLTADLVDAVGAQVGEAPLWDSAHDCLVWVDITAGLVHLSSGVRRRTFEVGTHVGAAMPARQGGWLLATREGFSHLSEEGVVSSLLRVNGPGIRFNDAKCDLAGRAWAGTMAYDLRPGAGTLYRLDSTATAVLSGLTLCNGLDWSPDGRTMWFVDSATQSIAAFEYSGGGLGPLKGRLAINPAEGMPDGLCVDDDGCVWVALWGGGRIHRYTPAGVLDTVVHIPVSQVTSCCFGGSTLFITTAVHELGAAAEPLAGGLFAVETGTTGRVATPWQERE